MGWPSKTELLILRMLISGGESYGLALVKASEGALKRGTIYVTLGRMEEKGLVRSHPEPAPLAHVGIPRRLYEVTGAGRRALVAAEQAASLLAGVGEPIGEAL